MAVSGQCRLSEPVGRLDLSLLNFIPV